MKTLEFPDRHHLNSAVGWLELGNRVEAHAEAERISLLGRAHFETFLVRWQIAAAAADWTQALALARGFTQICPAEPRGWIFHAYTLFQLRRRLEAALLLVPKLTQFPEFGAIPYLLAALAAEQGNARLAEHYYARAVAVGVRDDLPEGLPACEMLSSWAGGPSTPPVWKSPAPPYT